jgi:hypothetical protein
MTSAGDAAAIAEGLGKAARKAGSRSSTRAMPVCWAITSDTSTAHASGPPVERKASSRPWAANHPRTARRSSSRLAGTIDSAGPGRVAGSGRTATGG